MPSVAWQRRIDTLDTFVQRSRGGRVREGAYGFVWSGELAIISRSFDTLSAFLRPLCPLVYCRAPRTAQAAQRNSQLPLKRHKP